MAVLIELTEVVVKWLSFYVYRIVLLLSILMYFILAFFSESRRREGKGWKRGLLWLAYQLTDWCPAYVISNLYLETKPHDKMIVAFWVPFLLLHNARPDNISAYISEDSELWLRVYVFAPLQSLGSAFIVYRYILSDCTTGLLRHSSFIMLLLGLYKYGESVVVLRRCSLSRIRKSFRKLQPNASRFSDDYGGGKNLDDLKDEDALLVAHSLFDICKGAFSDYSVGYKDRDAIRSMFTGRWKSMCKVVEMELSLMYDILYTKAAIVHTWHGYAIRVVSPPLTATALLLFFLQCKECMKLRPIDEPVSYILLGTTLLHDVRWLLRALASAWTHSYFKHMSHNWLKHEFWCRGKWAKLRRFVVSLPLSRLSLWLWTCTCPKEPKSYRSRVGTLGQCNLLGQCIAGGRHNLHSIPRRARGTDSSSRDLEISDYLMQLVFSNICTSLFPRPLVQHRFKMRVKRLPRSDEQAAEHSTDCLRYNRAPSEPYEQVNLWRHVHTEANYEVVTVDTKGKAAGIKDDDTSFPLELQEVILIWHIATDILLSCGPEISEGESKKHAKVIERMSDYMMFLVAERPEMLPGLKLRSLYEETRDTLQKIYSTEEKTELAKQMLVNMDDRLKDPHPAIILNGTLLALKLLSLVPNDGGSNITREAAGTEATVKRLSSWIPLLPELNEGDMEDMLKFVLDAWVRLLMYASIRCGRDAHAKQLSCGGELTTLVWIITEHAKNSVVKRHLKLLFR